MSGAEEQEPVKGPVPDEERLERRAAFAASLREVNRNYWEELTYQTIKLHAQEAAAMGEIVKKMEPRSRI